jgi:hypothetical protein
MNPPRVSSVIVRTLLGTVLTLGVLSLSGCITGHEAEDEMAHDQAAELQETQALEEIGAISETTYELKKARIESED